MTIIDNELIAQDGYVLTNGEVYAESVYLGIYDSPSNWHEIPIEEMPQEEG